MSGSRTASRTDFVLSGASGYLGTRLKLGLEQAGHSVQGVDQRDRTSHSPRAPGAVWLQFAGISDVAACERDPVSAQQANVELALESVRLAQASGCTRWVLASSALLLAAPPPATVYLRTKAQAEHECARLAHELGLAALALRFSNVFGAPPKPGTVLERVLGQIYGPPAAPAAVSVRRRADVRDYLWVDDLSAVIAQLGSAPPNHAVWGEPWLAVSSGVGSRVEDLIGLAMQIAWGTRAVTIVEEAPESEPSVVSVDPRPIQTLLGWRPQVSLEQGLYRVWEAQRAKAPATSEAKPNSA